jgi:RNA polymerase sigma factor (TIGR02999 family)
MIIGGQLNLHHRLPTRAKNGLQQTQPLNEANELLHDSSIVQQATKKKARGLFPRARLETTSLPREFKTRYAQRIYSCVLCGMPSGGMLGRMSDITQLLSAIEQGDLYAAEQLLPLVYAELRKLAAVKMAQEASGRTLQATALVHEAYLRLVDVKTAQRWNSRGHFFAAAAEAMRRILVEQARQKQRLKHGGERQRVDLSDLDVAAEAPDERILALSEALDQLAGVNPRAAELVKLRYFAGLTGHEAAQVLNISPRKADQIWAYARAWLLECLNTEQA